MKLSSKSILSPSHSRESPQMSLSSSFSKRLVTNGSIKGGGQASASPMFPSVGRKRGSGFENSEPSSPKVTCIGQVRVKTKKQGKKKRARSKRRSGEEASFRKTEQNFQVALNLDLTRQKSQKNNQSCQYQNHHQQNLQQKQECFPQRNQRWVHLPLTICEALKGFGAEFSCFFPCRSSCTRAKELKAEEEAGGVEGRRSRWLVTVQEGDDAKEREIELIMGEEEEEEEDRTTDDRVERRHRRHVFEDINFEDIEKLKNEEFEGEEKGRVSICIPPKNALLLMRCRSDPVKVTALANRFLEPTVQKEDFDDMEEEEEGEEEQVPMEEDKQVRNTIHESEKGVAFVHTKEAEVVEAKATNLEINEASVAHEEEEAKAEKEDEDGATLAEEKVKDEGNDVVESAELSPSFALSAPSEPQNNEVAAKGSTEKVTTEEERPMEGAEEKGSKVERESGTLPECLLLMMCEPKLSMEVSRETWVCTADFIRWLPPRPSGKTGGGDRQPKKRVAVDSKPPLAPAPPPPLIQPARSSCSFPAPVVGSNDYDPLVLTRCKSEPRGSAAAKLPKDGCFWNSRKLMEPHPPAHLGIGAAGVGF